MARKTFLIAEPPPYEGISTRKLVLETAYFNVLTAYSEDDLVESLKAFPNVDAVVLHTGLKPGNSEKLAKQIKKIDSKMPILAVTVSESEHIPGVEQHISSHDPQKLLTTLCELFGDPRGKSGHPSPHQR